MCGNIKKLRFPDRPATAGEVDAAVSQFLRKICNMRRPAAVHQAAFGEANAQISASLHTMLDGLRIRRADAMTRALFKRADPA